MKAIDPVTLEIINNRLRFISKEMVITLTRIAYSAVIYDGHDCSAGIFDAKGQLLTLDAGLPFHISPMPFSVSAVLEKYRNNINPGDIFIANDPSFGGTHLPDMLILMPIFFKENLAFFAAARGHWTDVGGSTPGSLSGKANELIQEGIIIPPIKLFEQGKLNQDLADLLFTNMRMREIRQGDMMSQVAACRHGERGCVELIEKYGMETTIKCGEEIINRTEESLRRKLKAIPEGAYYYEDYLDNDGLSNKSVRIKVEVSVKDGSVFVDFAGSSPQSQGPVNCSLSTTHGAVVIAVKSIVDPHGIPNEGLFRLIKINAPLGTLLNPKPGAPTGGFTESGYRVVFCIVGALAEVLPQCVSGADYGSVNHTYISGIDESKGDLFIHYEYPPGGNGGTFLMDGPNGMRGPSSGNVSLQSVELIESLSPLRCSYATLREDSGGPGRFRGGLGLVRKVEVLAQSASLSTVTDRSAIPPFGIFKGQSGYGQYWSVIRNGIEKPLPFSGKVSNYKLKKGDIFQCLTAGGGGYGDPLERDPDIVRKDVIEGYVSMEAARETYGVVLNETDISIREQETQDQRQIIGNSRKLFTLGRYGVARFVKGVKAVMLSTQEATEFSNRSLVEIYHDECAAPHRARVILSSKVKPKYVLIDNESANIIGAKDGDILQLIALSTPF